MQRLRNEIIQQKSHISSNGNMEVPTKNT